MLSVKQGGIKLHFFDVFRMTWPGIETQFTGQLVNILTIRSMGQ